MKLGKLIKDRVLDCVLNTVVDRVEAFIEVLGMARVSDRIGYRVRTRASDRIGHRVWCCVLRDIKRNSEELA